jgi:hypothetical protein
VDDGAKLWVNNTVIIDKFSSTGTQEYTGSITLQAGKQYAIKMEYKDVSGYAQAQLGWPHFMVRARMVPLQKYSKFCSSCLSSTKRCAGDFLGSDIRVVAVFYFLR